MPLRTWKDGINESPRIVCAICGCSRDQFDHSICHAVAEGRGHFNGPFVVIDGEKDDDA